MYGFIVWGLIKKTEETLSFLDILRVCFAHLFTLISGIYMSDYL